MKAKPSTRSRTKTPTEPAAPTRLTRATSVKSVASSTKNDSSTMKPAGRMPLVNRSNSPDKVPTRSSPTMAKVPSYDDEMDREPVKAFLRIRPQTGDDAGEGHTAPYLDPISNTTVRMIDPSSSGGFRSRASTVNPSSLYTFSHIFPPSTQQPEFFTKTTLPLVQDVLDGESCLLFTYGVTNSGKTHTIQGGSGEGNAGILPRTLDVIFNSIEGLQGDGRYQPVRLQGIEPASVSSPTSFTSQHHGSSKRSLVDLLDDSSTPELSDVDQTTLKLDRNHEYTIWLSYAEVYNEKVYDLLASVDDPSGLDTRSTPTPSSLPRPTSNFLSLPLPTSQSKPLLLSRKALQVKPCPISDYEGSSDAGSQGRYIAGIRQLHVTSAAQAKELLRLGQMHRRVFGTLANSQSSRSHALVTIKVLKLHRGERNNSAAIQTSRLTLVDLAGSERTKHTQTSGERLREAGNINKSLMVLGQCMETMRTNQRIIARSLANSVDSTSRLDTRDLKRALGVVPFRHSKLTEILMDYFVGEGRVVMIVNVNPYDTGYDENSHVMKFAALARDVCTIAPTAVTRMVPVRAKTSLTDSENVEVVPHRRKVTISVGGPGKKMSEAHLEVLEEDEERDGDEDDDEPINPLVDALFDEIEALRMQLFESEMRCAILEADTREEVMQEMEERMHNMEKMYTRRLMKEIEQNEAKMDAKIDMIQRAGGLPIHSSSSLEESLEDIEEEEELESTLDRSRVYDEDEHFDSSRSPSPLVSKGLRKQQTKSSDSNARQETEESQSTSEDEEADEGSDSETETNPTGFGSSTTQPTFNSPHSRPSGSHVLVPPSPIFEVKATKLLNSRSQPPKRGSSLATVLEKTRSLSLADDDDDRGKARDSIVVIPDKKARAEAATRAGPGVQYVPGPDEVVTAKKKKRQIGQNAAVSKAASENATGPSDAGRQLRRSVRGR